jgi:subfamily B ATP-binding cassette protein MsbA
MIETGVVMYSFGADLYYANVKHFVDEVQQLLREASAVCYLIVDAEAITGIDFSAGQALLELQRDLSERGIVLALARVSGQLRADLNRHQVTVAIGTENIFLSRKQCLAACRNATPSSSTSSRSGIETRLLETGLPDTAPPGRKVRVPPPSVGRDPESLRSTGLVLDLLRPYRRWLAIVFVAMLLETAMSLAAPWPLKIVIDSVIAGHSLPGWLSWLRDFSGAHDTARLAMLAGVGVVLIAAIGAIASYIDNYFTESVGQWVANDLRLRLYHHLERLSLAYYDTHQTGPMLSTITDDVGTIQDFASSATLTMLVDLLTIVGILIVMFSLNWDFALIAVSVTPFLLFFVSRLKRTVKRATHAVRKCQSEILAVAEQGLQSMRTVKAFGRQELEESRMREVSYETVQASLKARRVKSLLSPVVAVTVSCCTGFVLWRGASLIGSKLMTVGTLTVFLSYLSKFFKPVQDLAKMTNTLAQTAVALERSRTILDTNIVIRERPDARSPAGPFRGEIAFEKVAFAYSDHAPVLREISLRILPGQRIGIVGPTGSGKSTVVSLIPRFYDASAGCITIDGTDVCDFSLQGLRQQIAIVLQDTLLFRGTIRENIGYGRPGATGEEILQAAKLANADEFIARLPQNYETPVGERGATLSGGQRQRIGIARALLRNAPILILDEPTAALDTKSERLVMEALEKLMKGRTVITIAHRLSTVRSADRIVVLKDGLIAEEGTHDELLASKGLYAELYRIQSEPTH